MHLEKLLLIGSTECGLASFRSSWIGDNNFPFQEAAYPKNSIVDSNVVPTEQLTGIEPNYNYDDNVANEDVHPSDEVGPWSINGPMVGQPIPDSNVGIISTEKLPDSQAIEPTHNIDYDAIKTFNPTAPVGPWSIHGPKVGQPIKDSNIGMISSEQLDGIEPTHNYDDDLTSKDVQPSAEVGQRSIHGTKVGQPVEDSNVGIISTEQSPEIEPTHNLDNDGANKVQFPYSGSMNMGVYDFGGPSLAWSPQSVFKCGHNEYEISIAMGSDLWSGTDDKVEIRLYFPDGSVSEWFNLHKPMYNAFERLSTDSFCVRPQRGILRKPSFIGFRKLGHDQMKVESIMVSTVMSSSVFNVGQWIKTNDEKFY